MYLYSTIGNVYGVHVVIICNFETGKSPTQDYRYIHILKPLICRSVNSGNEEFGSCYNKSFLTDTTVGCVITRY